MPTRIDIDDELAERLRGGAKARGISLREYVCDLLEEAASLASSRCELRERYVQEVHDLGAHLDNPWAILVDLELEKYVKLLSKK